MEAVVDLVNRVRLELVPPDGDAKDSLRKAWCYWTVSVTFKDVFGAKTFGWVALGIIFDALKTLGSAPE
jgi:RNA-dependent RNA polymerase